MDKIKTNVSWDSLAGYAALCWNYNEEPSMPTGDAFLDALDDEDEDFIITIDYLRKELDWNLEKQSSMMNEEFFYYHRDYMEGARDELTIHQNELYVKALAEFKEFRRKCAAWVKNATRSPEIWEYTPETEFVRFEEGTKAVPLPKPDDCEG